MGDRVAVAPDDQTSTGRELLGWDIAPLCCCDLGYSGTTTAQDVFDFLAMFFGSAADFNNDGATTAQDIFDFLTCWFGGCV